VVPAPSLGGATTSVETEPSGIVQEAEALLSQRVANEVSVTVIGGGPGGYTAAIRAAQLGGKVTLVERDELGGTCLNRGCIPTKALLEAAETLRTVRRARDWGIEVGPVSFSFEKMAQRMQRTVKQLRTGLEFLLEKHKIELVRGTARLVGPTQVEVQMNAGGVRAIQAERIILAAGSVPVRPSLPGADGLGVVTSDGLLAMTTQPERLIVIGGGAVGIEFAALFQELGTQVTVLEMLPTILPTEDRDVSVELSRLFERAGMTLLTGARVTEIVNLAGEPTVTYQRAGTTSEVTGEVVLLAVGRKAETEALGLRAVGLECDRANVIVNDRLETSLRGVYAIGDAVRGVGLAHLAMAEGVVAAENAMGQHREIDRELVPNCLYTHPEVASVGLTEQAAQQAGLAVRVGKFTWRASGRAATMGEREGFVKVIAREDDETIVGVHIVGPRATDLIAEAVLVLKFGMNVTELAETMHAHPTFAEALVEAALATRGEAIHQ